MSGKIGNKFFKFMCIYVLGVYCMLASSVVENTYYS